MMHTEQSAKECWCPFARAVGYLSGEEGLVDTASNRHPDPIIMDQVRCIASHCMAWRWGEPPDEPAGIVNYIGPAPQRKGYCGLAGKP